LVSTRLVCVLPASEPGDVIVIRFLTSAVPAIVLAAAVAPLSAQRPPPPSITLEQALDMFAEGNLELRLARSNADQAAALARQARAFPNPSVNATHEPLWGGPGPYSETYVTASQRLEVSGARGARGEAADGRSLAAFERVRGDSTRLAFVVKRAYVDAFLAQERRAVTERIVDVFREASRSATERYEEGDASLYALQRIRAERARYETLLADAELQVGSAQRSLAILVAPTGDDERLAAEGLPSATPPDVEDARLAASAVEDRAELTAARAEVEAEMARERLERAEKIPDLTATGGFKRQSEGLRGAFFGLSVPVPLFDRRAGAVDAAQVGLRAAEERLALTRRQLENDVLQAIDAYRTLRERSELLTETGTEGEADLLDIALVAYAEGEMELVELLDAADALHEARTAEATLRGALWVAYFDLERALGGFVPTPARGDRP
jgi:cobalt-zinc-cadmium efflux system outer membrane protein